MDSSVSNIKLKESERQEHKRMVEEWEKKNGPVKLKPIEIRDPHAAASRMYETSKQKKARERNGVAARPSS